MQYFTYTSMHSHAHAKTSLLLGQNLLPVDLQIYIGIVITKSLSLYKTKLFFISILALWIVWNKWMLHVDSSQGSTCFDEKKKKMHICISIVRVVVSIIIGWKISPLCLLEALSGKAYYIVCFSAWVENKGVTGST